MLRWADVHYVVRSTIVDELNVCSFSCHYILNNTK